MPTARGTFETSDWQGDTWHEADGIALGTPRRSGDASPFLVANRTDGTITKAQLLAPHVAVLGNNVLIADNDTTPGDSDNTDFGSVQEHGAALIRAFTVTNLGPVTLNTSELSMPSGFTLVEESAG